MYLIGVNDLVYENDVCRDQSGSIKPWMAYIEYAMKHGSLLQQAFVMERACNHLPRSYKLWKMYLTLRIKHLLGLNPASYKAEFAKVNALFERALILLNKMPRLWEDYLTCLLKQPLVTKTRRAFDRALKSLPITQHERVWKLYRPFAESAGGITATHIWKRYMQLHPGDAESYIKLLIGSKRYTEAVREYLRILDNPKFKSREGKSEFQLWEEMVDLLVFRAKQIKTGYESGIDVDRIIRSGMVRFGDQRGKLWVGLATWHVAISDFEAARSTLEEGIADVMTVRDFTMIFDSYVEFEEAMIGKLMEASSTKTKNKQDADLELDVKMLQFEQLMDRRPFLLNDVLLRQNPNAVSEWEKRVALWGPNATEAVQTFSDAIVAINPKKAVGRFSDLWVKFAKFYESGGDLRNASIIFEKAVKVPYKSVAELADVWCAWAEMELRSDHFDQAMAVLAKATIAPKRSTVDYFDEKLSPQQRVHKSWKLWSFYVDLVESVGSLTSTRLVYERIFELKIATPQTVVNYANLLEEAGYFEDSYRVYERGLALFSYPVAFELWNLYLTKATDRQISLEILRDLFEQALDGVPPQFAKTLYLMYGTLEEERGLARSAMRIYERATHAVSDDDRPSTFEFYAAKSAANFGLTSTRPIYERAIAVLPDAAARDMCARFAEMEMRLGEIDRVRAIHGHAAQFCDPRTEPEFWERWREFEVRHGNEDTFREMLRIKRSVQAQFNTDVNFIAAQAVALGRERKGLQSVAEDGEEDEEQVGADAMEVLERQAARVPQGFVAASTGPVVSAVVPPVAAPAVEVANPDAIDLDE